MNISEYSERLRRVEAVILDSDGVIFTGHVVEGSERPLAKIRCHADGQGVSLLRAAGIHVFVATGECEEHASFLLSLVRKWNEMPSRRAGKWSAVSVCTGVSGKQKVEAASTWLRALGLSFLHCAAMGDDLTDYNLLNTIRNQNGFTAAPAQAEDAIKKIAHWVSPRAGGNGAIRDLVNLILEAQEIDIQSLDLR